MNPGLAQWVVQPDRIALVGFEQVFLPGGFRFKFFLLKFEFPYLAYVRFMSKMFL